MDNEILLKDIKLTLVTDAKIAFTPMGDISWFTILWDMRNIEHINLLLSMDNYLENNDIINACYLLMNIKTLKDYFIAYADKKICISFNFLKHKYDIEYILFIPILKNNEIYLEIDLNYSKVFEKLLNTNTITDLRNEDEKYRKNFIRVNTK